MFALNKCSFFSVPVNRPRRSSWLFLLFLACLVHFDLDLILLVVLALACFLFNFLLFIRV